MWPRIITVLAGLWLMVAPSVLGHTGISADNDHIAGPVIATFAFTAIWEVTRVVRLYNVPIALWLLLAPWVLGYESTAAIVSDMAVGVLVLGLSFIRGTVEQRFGGGWSAVWKSNSLHVQEAQKRERQSS